jgi:NTP pyrophosphatase (non-canonical NTP hydrolase)
VQIGKDWWIVFWIKKTTSFLTGNWYSVMDIKQLTDEMNRLVRSKGWYDASSKRPQTPRNLAVSLSIEAAEILEHFQFTDEIKDRDELGSELADVTLYLLQLASVSGIDLEEAVLKKIEVNKTREWDS